MGKHGEPWKIRDRRETSVTSMVEDGIDKEQLPWDVYRKAPPFAFGEFACLFADKNIADRAVLCVNACEGMSDEEVKIIGGLGVSTPIADSYKASLKAQLAKLKIKNKQYKDVCIKDANALILASVKRQSLQAQLLKAGEALQGILEIIPRGPKLPVTWQIKEIADATLTQLKEE